MVYRPQEIDEAARRRLVKRLYIPLPDGAARKQIVSNLLKRQAYSLTPEELEEISTTTEGIRYLRVHTHTTVTVSYTEPLHAQLPIQCILVSPQATLGQTWLTCVVRQPTVQSGRQLRPFNTSQLTQYVYIILYMYIYSVLHAHSDEYMHNTCTCRCVPCSTRISRLLCTSFDQVSRRRISISMYSGTNNLVVEKDNNQCPIHQISVTTCIIHVHCMSCW